jgi:hypothetical protein
MKKIILLMLISIASLFAYEELTVDNFDKNKR